MSHGLLFACAGLGLLATGLWALVLRRNLVRKVLAINIMGSGIFLVLVGTGQMGANDTDPVPQAMVITGIVVTISATALALALILRIANKTGKAELPEAPTHGQVDDEEH